MELVIERSKWLRGQKDSYLLHPDNGTMCCLGFLGCAVGLSKKVIKGQGVPSEVKTNKWPELINSKYAHSTDLCDKIVVTNDSILTTDKAKERKLKALFKKADIHVTFVD